MHYNFDTIVDRKNTNSIKYDFMEEFHKPADCLSMWVADMDFQSPIEVREALTKVVEQGIYGYTDMKEDYFDAVSSWFETGFGWKPEKEWVIKTPGVVFAIALAVQAFTDPGDSIIIQTPVYYPFARTVKNNERNLVTNPLKYENGKYVMDFEDFEEKIKKENVKMFILCSPHNPVGRVWTKEELVRLGDICDRYGVIVVSDEIHCDFVYEGYKHTIYASLGDKYASHSVICTAPSKTFNLAGLQGSNIFIPNEELRKKYLKAKAKTAYQEINMMAFVATKAAYTFGRPWLTELKQYLAGNVGYVREFLKKEMPSVRLIEPEGTYLIWMDFSELGLSDEELDDRIVNKAGLWLDKGTMFGSEGEFFQRMNIACPRQIVVEAMERLKKIL